jgi:hypothetical protein
MKEEIIYFAFMGCLIFAGAAITFVLLYLISPTFRTEVQKDWKGE